MFENKNSNNLILEMTLNYKIIKTFRKDEKIYLDDKQI